MFENPSSLKLSPIQFELEAKKLIEASGCELENFAVNHLEKLVGMDGEYEIDIVARFSALGASFKVLIECKRYSSSVKRDVVQVLREKMNSVGAQKGMIFTTSGFQSGAVEYAALHGIALVQLVDGRTTFLTRSHHQTPLVEIENPPVCGWLISIPKGSSLTMTRVSEEDASAVTAMLKQE